MEWWYGVMKLQTYQADSMAAALAKVKADLGRSAVILHTRSFKKGGLWGWRAKNVVEITATGGEEGLGSRVSGLVKKPPTRMGRQSRSIAPDVAKFKNPEPQAPSPRPQPLDPKPQTLGPAPTGPLPPRFYDEIETIRRMVGDVLAESRRNK